MKKETVTLLLPAQPGLTISKLKFKELVTLMVDLTRGDHLRLMFLYDPMVCTSVIAIPTTPISIGRLSLTSLTLSVNLYFLTSQRVAKRSIVPRTSMITIGNQGVGGHGIHSRLTRRYPVSQTPHVTPLYPGEQKGLVSWSDGASAAVEG